MITEALTVYVDDSGTDGKSKNWTRRRRQKPMTLETVSTIAVSDTAAIRFTCKCGARISLPLERLVEQANIDVRNGLRPLRSAMVSMDDGFALSGTKWDVYKDYGRARDGERLWAGNSSRTQM